MLDHLDLSFSRKILRWYDKNARDLPWRHTRNPYFIWISEIMLQQTTVKAVLPYYERWIKKFSSIESLASANIETVLKTWQGLGYYSRAKNIHKAARIIVDQFNAEIPRDPKILADIPGFGPYTVAAVLSIAYGIKLPVVDTNVRRVCVRLSASREKTLSKNDSQLRIRLLQIMSSRRPGDFNQAIMELGAKVCRSREPVCNLCPVQENCLAFNEGIQEIIPEPQKTKIIEVQAVVAIIRHKGKIFIQKRADKGLLAGLWEFPGGKIEPNETPQSALIRELKEELALENVTVGNELCRVTHFYTKFKVRLAAYECFPEKTLIANGETRLWCRKNEFIRYPMPSGSARILPFL